MALTLDIRPGGSSAETLPGTPSALFVNASGHDRTTSTLTVRRRIHPTDREDPALAFIPADELSALVTISEGRVFGIASSLGVFDFLVRSGVPYQYQAREVYADGSNQSWTAWLPVRV